MFIGENLTNLRLLFGYSQGQLASLVELPERDIWQFENGYKTPQFNEVNKLKSLFHVKSTYFYRPDLISNKKQVVDVSHISFRY